MLAELISSRRILKAQLLEFLGLPDNCQDKTDHLVSTIVSVLEVDAAEQARFWDKFKSELAVEPVELEKLLKCSPKERQEWIAEFICRQLGLATSSANDGSSLSWRSSRFSLAG